MPEISIIILTFNSVKLIKSCLDSISCQDYKDFEIIIVDNGSGDGTVDFIKEQYPQLILIENKKNLGAARGRNLGIDIARGRWIFTQDCDVILEKDLFTQITKLTEELPFDIGIIQPKILQLDKKTIYSCGVYLSRILKRYYDIGRGKIDKAQFNKKKYVFGACSAAAFYRKNMLEELKEDTGYFDERFFFLVEDVDLSWRAQRRGFKALCYPNAVCYHLGNSSLCGKPLRQYLNWRNRKILLTKWKFNHFQSMAVYLMYDFPRLLFLLLNNRYVRKEIKDSKINISSPPSF